MKTIIAGSRTIDKYNLVCEAVTNSGFDITEIVSGGAKGVDEVGERYGKNHAIPVRIFPADWSTHGRSAGPIRNKKMAEYADALVAIWDGSSKGTKHMLNEANDRGLAIYLLRTNGEPVWTNQK
jgi:hypothetical protein